MTHHLIYLTLEVEAALQGKNFVQELLDETSKKREDEILRAQVSPRETDLGDLDLVLPQS